MEGALPHMCTGIVCPTIGLLVTADDVAHADGAFCCLLFYCFLAVDIFCLWALRDISLLLGAFVCLGPLTATCRMLNR